VKKNFLKLTSFIFGIFILAFGVALSVKSNLGVSPISCVPYVCSFKSQFTLGELTIFFNTILVVLQIIILRKSYRFLQLIQLPMVFIFGIFIDFNMSLISNLVVSTFFGKLIFALISCVVMGVGVYIEVKSNITYLPGEGLVIAISDTIKKEFGKVKISMDTSMVILGVIISILFFHKIKGLGVGTILAAFSVGAIVRMINKISDKFIKVKS